MNKQLTREEAIAFFDSGVWKTWTSKQIVDLQLYQDLMCLPFGTFMEALEKELGHPVWTHELAFKGVERIRAEYEGRRGPPTFEEWIEPFSGKNVNIVEKE